KPNVEVRPFDLGQPSVDGFQAGSFDTVVCANVLEHIDQDVQALRTLHRLLAPGGRVVLVVPALRPLYGSIDQAIGHYRPYSADEIGQKLAAAGLDVEHVHYFNLLGVPGWFLNARLLRRRSVPGFQARVNDWLVPLLRLERHVSLPLGMSLLAVGRSPG